jgi:hemerythrin-like domain-containing protein
MMFLLKEVLYMERYMNSGIKDVIREFPEVGTILDSFGIGCVNCSVGTCLMKDIIGIHNLSRKQEAELMGWIEKAIYPDREIKVEAYEEEEDKGPIKYAVPIRELVDEHERIKILLRNIPKICEMMRSVNELDYKLILDCVEFIKNYADKFHHSKEEEILFKYIDENSEVVKSMLEEHKLARWFVRSILNGVEKNNLNAVIENLTNYGELLMEHIRKEDEVLYPYIERNISEVQVDELTEKFRLIDEEIGEAFYEKWYVFLEKIRKFS